MPEPCVLLCRREMCFSGSSKRGIWGFPPCGVWQSTYERLGGLPWQLYCNGMAILPLQWYGNGMAMVWRYRCSGPLWRWPYGHAAADSTGLRPNRRGKGVLPTILAAQFACVALQNSMAALIGGFTNHSFGEVPVGIA